MSGKVTEPEPEPKPKDSLIFIYMQILHVRKINTVEQTFHAKLYFRATWVQKKPSEKSKITVDPWSEEIYRPNLSFENAIDVVEFKHQSIQESQWREPLHGNSTKEVVMEWKVILSSVFTHNFKLENYPNDVQLLKINITATDGTEVYDDKTVDVNSAIRNDYFLDHQVKVVKEVKAVKEVKEEDKVTEQYVFEELKSHTDDHVKHPFKKKDQKQDQKKDNDQDSKQEDKHGDHLYSISQKFPIDTRTFFSLSYIIPCERISKHPKREILFPVSLIGTVSFATFVYPVYKPVDRFAVSITIALVMTSYMYIMTQYLPRTEDVSVLSTYIQYSFLMVFAILLEIAITSLIACGGYCNEEDEEDTTLTHKVIDWALSVLFFCYWLGLNMWVYGEVFKNQKSKEKERVIKEIKKIKGTTNTNVSK